jgi:type II secretory pathway predicted ATPase ExeA
MNSQFSKWNWKENPFILKIDPRLFVGYEEQVKAVQDHINNKHKIALISGRTGSGKTTFLKWIESQYDDAKLYVSKPPKNPEDFIPIFTSIFGLSFWERLLRRTPNLYTLPAYINKKLKGKHLVFLLDEAHETNKDVLEWLRVLTDQIDGISLIIAGMPVLESKIKSELETLDQRITTRINLDALDKESTKELIKKRIEDVGGTGTKPFTELAVNKIYERTGGFPREILKFCDRLSKSAIEKDLETIDISHIEEHKEIEVPKARLQEPVVTFIPKPPTDEELRDLPYKQKKILEILSQKDWLIPTAITEEIGWESYKSKGHAIRSINNILTRLMREGFVQRESRGKAFMYALTPKVKTFFVEK